MPALLKNSIRERWNKGIPTINGWLTLPVALSAEIMARAGFDSLTIDMQHGAIDYSGALGLLTALAATEVIHQQGRAFSSENATIKKGEALTFLNDDSVPHNIMSTSKGNEFNLGSQPPGSSTDVTFKEPGEVQVICAIHPRMKMTVKVTD